MNTKTLHVYYKSDDLPDDLKQFTDHWLLLQHRILTRRWQRQTDKSGRYTLLKRQYISDELTAPIASKLINWGRESKSLISDDRYVIGDKSFGYRLSKVLEGLPTQRRALNDSQIVQRLKEQDRRDYQSYTKAHRHLYRWLRQVSVTFQATEDALALSLKYAQS